MKVLVEMKQRAWFILSTYKSVWNERGNIQWSSTRTFRSMEEDAEDMAGLPWWEALIDDIAWWIDVLAGGYCWAISARSTQNHFARICNVAET